MDWPSNSLVWYLASASTFAAVLVLLAVLAASRGADSAGDAVGAVLWLGSWGVLVGSAAGFATLGVARQVMIRLPIDRGRHVSAGRLAFFAVTLLAVPVAATAVGITLTPTGIDWVVVAATATAAVGLGLLVPLPGQRPLPRPVWVAAAGVALGVFQFAIAIAGVVAAALVAGWLARRGDNASAGALLLAWIGPWTTLLLIDALRPGVPPTNYLGIGMGIAELVAAAFLLARGIRRSAQLTSPS